MCKDWCKYGQYRLDDCYKSTCSRSSSYVKPPPIDKLAADFADACRERDQTVVFIEDTITALRTYEAKRIKLVQHIEDLKRQLDEREHAKVEAEERGRKEAVEALDARKLLDQAVVSDPDNPLVQALVKSGLLLHSSIAK